MLKRAQVKNNLRSMICVKGWLLYDRIINLFFQCNIDCRHDEHSIVLDIVFSIESIVR